MEILLIAGLWLDGSGWNDVAAQLERLGHHPVPLTVPGQGDGSAASTLAWLAADARPEKVAKVVLIGGFPSSDGEHYADFFEVTDGVMPFPGWGPFEGPDAVDLDEEAR